MTAVCLIDTTVFVNILRVPRKSSDHETTVKELRRKIQWQESLFLPFATILETGNHIAQNGDGNQRRKCAQQFIDQVRKALDEESPFTAIRAPQMEDLRTWLSDFPNQAMQGHGLGDLTIVHDWRRLCAQNRGRRVYIWSLDQHLSGYDQVP